MSDFDAWTAFRRGETPAPSEPHTCCECGQECDGDIRFEDGACLCENCTDADRDR